jgi:hypothetical protein
MKMLWMAILLTLAGCNQGFEKFTAIDFGDSVSLAYAGHARLALYGGVDFRHDAWEDEDLVPVDAPYFFGKVVAMGHNNGYSTTLVDGMTNQLEGQHYNVILFNSGLHDLQPRAGAPNIDLGIYAQNIEIAAEIAEQHGDVVIWIDTTDVPADLDPSVQQYGAPAHAQVPYNQEAHAIARAHGFYILNISSDGQRAHDVHFHTWGARKQGNEVAACVLIALQQEETDICHK